MARQAPRTPHHHHTSCGAAGRRSRHVPAPAVPPARPLPSGRPGSSRPSLHLVVLLRPQLAWCRHHALDRRRLVEPLDGERPMAPRAAVPAVGAPAANRHHERGAHAREGARQRNTGASAYNPPGWWQLSRRPQAPLIRRRSYNTAARPLTRATCKPHLLKSRLGRLKPTSACGVSRWPDSPPSVCASIGSELLFGEGAAACVARGIAAHHATRTDKVIVRVRGRVLRRIGAVARDTTHREGDVAARIDYCPMRAALDCQQQVQWNRGLVSGWSPAALTLSCLVAGHDAAPGRKVVLRRVMIVSRVPAAGEPETSSS
eukprot:2876735-Prymnesium_polylepis.1